MVMVGALTWPRFCGVSHEAFGTTSRYTVHAQTRTEILIDLSATCRRTASRYHGIASRFNTWRKLLWALGSP